MKKRVCKNCSRDIPENSPYKYCEHCRNIQIDRLKNGMKRGSKVLGAVACVALTVVSKGRINFKK